VRICGKVCSALALAALLGGTAIAQSWGGPGFLRFAASRTPQKNSHSIAVTVGLFAKRDNAGGWVKAKDEDVWFQGVIDGSEVGAPGQYRWTDGAACPAAMTQLRKLRQVAMPKPVLPIPVNDEVDEGDLYLDGRVYTLNLASANVNGQAVGAVSFHTNLNTDLARWVEGMLAALQPCWSRSAPKDMDPFRGTLGDARYLQRNSR
jgi:hypothetical protein